MGSRGIHFGVGAAGGHITSRCSGPAPAVVGVAGQSPVRAGPATERRCVSWPTFLSNDPGPSSSPTGPLDYARQIAAEKSPGPLAPFGALCLVPGVLLTGVGVAILFVDVMTQFLEWNAIWVFVVGVTLCCLGMWLLRYRGRPANQPLQWTGPGRQGGSDVWGDSARPGH